MTQETERELVERLRGFEVDHTPDGWPAIQMKDVSALLDYVAALEAKQADHIEQPVEMVKMPEPSAWLATYEDREGNSKFYPSTHKELAVENDADGKPQPLYTEQQVRAIEHACGIGAPQ